MAIIICVIGLLKIFYDLKLNMAYMLCNNGLHSAPDSGLASPGCSLLQLRQLLSDVQLIIDKCGTICVTYYFAILQSIGTE